MTDLLLGIDAGTTNIKAVAMTADGEERHRRSASNPVERPRPTWAEQDMETTWARTRDVVGEVTGSLDAEETIAAVGVTGQGGGCWLVGETTAARNAILWTDGRAADIVAAWNEDGTADALFEQFGYGVFAGQALPILCWLYDHEPEALDRAEALVKAKDWLKYRLTGELASDPTDMSLAHFEPVASTFAEELPDGVSVPRPLLADLESQVQSPTDTAGTVTPAAAEATGLPEGVPVVAGMFDVAATSVGSGCITAGATSVIAGTTLQFQRVMDAPRVEPPPVGYTLDLGVAGRGLRTMGAMTGTPNLDWARETLADDAPFAEVEAAARDVPPGSGGLLYLPYLSDAGEKAPFVEPAARAGFVGLEPAHERAHLLRAVYEGLAMSIRDCAEHVRGGNERVRLSGGGSRSSLLAQVFADALDATVAIPAGEELGALGVAAIAGVGVGTYPDLATAAAETVTVADRYEPRPAATAFYDDWYGVYAATSQSLREPWRRRTDVLDDHEIA